MKTAKFQQQFPAGTAIPVVVPSTPNVRVLNEEIVNEIPGLLFDPATGILTFKAPGMYNLVGWSSTANDVSLQSQISDVGGNVLAIGQSAAGPGGGPTSEATLSSIVTHRLRVDDTLAIQLTSVAGAAIAGTTATLCPVTGASIDVGAELVVTQD